MGAIALSNIFTYCKTFDIIGWQFDYGKSMKQNELSFIKMNTQYAFTVPGFFNYAVAGDWLFSKPRRWDSVDRQKIFPYTQVNIKVVHDCKTKLLDTINECLREQLNT